MRSVIITAVMCLLATGVYAQKIAVESGKKVDFLKGEKSVTVKFTYEDMKVGKMPESEYVAKKKSEADEKKSGGGESWHQAWVNDRATRYEPKFIELFNKQMNEKNGMLLGADEDGKYLMTVNTFFTEPGYNIGISRKPGAVSLRISLTEKGTGNEVAVVTVVNSSAADFMGTDFDAAYRIQECYAKAGRELAKFLIKNLKL